MDEFEILFMPYNKVVRVRKGASVLDAARKAFVDIETSCNGKGTCGKCRVRHINGPIGEPQDDELKHLSADETAAGIRLACRTKPDGTATYQVLGDMKRNHRILSDGFIPEFELNPVVKKEYVELSKPSLEDNIDDITRIMRAVAAEVSLDIPLTITQALPLVLRQTDFKVTLVFSGDRIMAVEPGNTTDKCFGVAVDIGTTTVVASLVDLNTGEELTSASMINPQKNYGLDVLTRIHYIREHPDGLATLSNLIRAGIDQLIGDVCGQASVDRRHVYEAAVAANATMMHLLLGVDATSLGASPYVSVFTSSLTIPAKDLSLKLAQNASVYCLPSVSSYIGADIVAGLITAELDKADEKTLFIDIGTNGEIVFGSKDGLYACSCAAGPALEGMNIACGMRAADGAIEKVSIDDEVVIQTIGDKPAVGICGSGIIDAVAELIKVEAVAPSGRFAKFSVDEQTVAWQSGIKNGQGPSRFVLSDATRTGDEIAITQKDIRQVQLAKGAILSGILSLTGQLDIGLEEIERVYVAGAFGHHVRMESLMRLGVLPEQCLDRVKLIGNSSKTGATLCLLSREKRDEASRVASQVKYIELSCHPGYDRLFADCLAFPKAGD